MSYFNKILLLLIYLIFNYSIADNNDIKINKIFSGIYFLNGVNEEPNAINQGAIANIAVIIGKKAVLVYDAGPSKSFALKLIKKIKSLTNAPIKYLIISHRHFDHAYGVEAFIEQGAKIYMDEREFKYFINEGPKINNLLIKNMGFNKNNINFDKILEKDITFLKSEKKINLGDRQVLISNLGEAHSKGDIIAYDYFSKTYIVGDFIFQGRAAAFSDANIHSWIKKIEQKLNLPWNYLIPGHGNIIDKKVGLNDTKNWLLFINKSIKKAITQGDMVSEVLDYEIPKNIRTLSMKKITLRQGLKRQIQLYKKKY